MTATVAGAHFCVPCCIELARVVAIPDRPDRPTVPPRCPLCGRLASFLTPSGREWLAGRCPAF